MTAAGPVKSIPGTQFRVRSALTRSAYPRRTEDDLALKLQVL